VAIGRTRSCRQNSDRTSIYGNGGGRLKLNRHAPVNGRPFCRRVYTHITARPGHRNGSDDPKTKTISEMGVHNGSKAVFVFTRNGIRRPPRRVPRNVFATVRKHRPSNSARSDCPFGTTGPAITTTTSWERARRGPPGVFFTVQNTYTPSRVFNDACRRGCMLLTRRRVPYLVYIAGPKTIYWEFVWRKRRNERARLLRSRNAVTKNSVVRIARIIVFPEFADDRSRNI